MGPFETLVKTGVSEVTRGFDTASTGISIPRRQLRLRRRQCRRPNHGHRKQHRPRERPSGSPGPFGEGENPSKL